MAIKARIGDIEFELETEADVRLFLSAAKNGAVTVQTPPVPDTIQDRLRRFYARLGSDHQRNVVRRLADAPEGLTDVALRSATGIENNYKLAGVMAGLSKHATAAGIRLEHVLTKQAARGGDASYQYRLSPEMREVASRR